MALGVSEESGVRIVEGTLGEPLMRRPQDAMLVLEACFSARVARCSIPRTSRHSSSTSVRERPEKCWTSFDAFTFGWLSSANPTRSGSAAAFWKSLSEDLRIFETRHEARLWLAQVVSHGAL